MSGTVLELEEKVDRLEQCSRRNCLLIHGVKEEKSENNNGLALLITKNDLNEEVNLTEIDSTHRFGKTSSKSRPMIVKFSRYKTQEGDFIF